MADVDGDAEARQLLSSLYGFGDDDKTLAKLLRHTDHNVTTADGATSTITSWKMQDYAYKRDPCPYPTRARGLFTSGADRIVARAYDKFFNVDEVSWTKWGKLPDLTTAPYYLTLKSNGCLILVAALSPNELLVTSKHAIGQAKEPGARSHAEVGEEWLNTGLKNSGKTRQDLAARLWKERLTCVAELCDDSFEEHILPYAAEKSGLHLHGLVVNHPTLLTLSPPEVNAFANAFGFIETPYVTLQSVEEVRDFTMQVTNNNGMWQNEHVEGFVVRAGLKAGSLSSQPHPNDLTEENWNDPRRVFMWKIKFDQPYLMWREWRETTNKILSLKKKQNHDVAAIGRRKLGQQSNSDAPKETSTLNKGKGRALIIEGEDDASLEDDGSRRTACEDRDEVADFNPKKLRNPETRVYAVWVVKRMETHPEDFAYYSSNRGIIAVRNEYLAWRETQEGQAQAKKTMGKDSVLPDAENVTVPTNFERTLLVPVAVPGCGKTQLGVALSALYGVAHTQSDDITFKKAAAHFEKNVADLLKEYPVVFADKNNHLKQHRKAMAEIASKSKHSTRLVALVWSLKDLPHNELHRICSDRIVERGQNHQSLRPVETGEHDIILMRFFSQIESFDPVFNTDSDAYFNNIVEMKITWSFEDALKHVVRSLADIGVLPTGTALTPAEIETATERVGEYKPKIIKEMKLDSIDTSAKGGGKFKGARYYAVAAEIDLTEILDDFLVEHRNSLSSADVAFFDKLRKAGRIEKKPHVTLVHEAELTLKEDKSNAAEVDRAMNLWGKCNKASRLSGDEAVTATLTLGPLLAWDGRAATVQVSQLTYSGTNVDPAAMPDDDQKHLYHITIGTLNDTIRPIEGRWLLDDAIKGCVKSRAGEIISKYAIKTSECVGRIKGHF